MLGRNTYNVFIQFKNGKSLEFIIESDMDIRKAILEDIDDTYLAIGDYIIDTREILWSRIEGDKIEELSG